MNVKQCKSKVTNVAECQVSGKGYFEGAALTNFHLFHSFLYKPSGGAAGQKLSLPELQSIAGSLLELTIRNPQ